MVAELAQEGQLEVEETLRNTTIKGKSSNKEVKKNPKG